MSVTKRTLAQHLAKDGQPKRILALDGGGLRGIVTLAILEKVEALLRQRHNDPTLRLCDYFDLIAGTSTGAIIAAALALGWEAGKLRDKYFELGEEVFKKSLLRQGLVRAKYDKDKLIAKLKGVYGKDTMLRSRDILTGLLVVTKRLDTGSWWPIGNNPAGKYFNARTKEDAETIGNGDYPLWQVVRASTAAPSYFDSEDIVIARQKGKLTSKGEFVDGGMSPFNNPALMAVMYATLEGYRLQWPTGSQNMFVVSIGTGAGDAAVKHQTIAAGLAVKGLLSLMEDCAQLQEMLLQWMSTSPTARTLDAELNDLANDQLAGTPLLSYLRYNADLNVDAVRVMAPELKTEKIESLTEMDAPANMKTLYELGEKTAARDVHMKDFSTSFDIK